MTTIEACPVKLMLLNQARGGDQDAYGYGYGYGADVEKKSWKDRLRKKK